MDKLDPQTKLIVRNVSWDKPQEMTLAEAFAAGDVYQCIHCDDAGVCRETAQNCPSYSRGYTASGYPYVPQELPPCPVEAAIKYYAISDREGRVYKANSIAELLAHKPRAYKCCDSDDCPHDAMTCPYYRAYNNANDTPADGAPDCPIWQAVKAGRTTWDKIAYAIDKTAAVYDNDD